MVFWQTTRFHNLIHHFYFPYSNPPLLELGHLSPATQVLLRSIFFLLFLVEDTQTSPCIWKVPSKSLVQGRRLYSNNSLFPLSPQVPSRVTEALRRAVISSQMRSKLTSFSEAAPQPAKARLGRVWSRRSCHSAGMRAFAMSVSDRYGDKSGQPSPQHGDGLGDKQEMQL